MSTSAELLACLDAIAHETTQLLRVIENAAVQPDVRREMKRRAFALRGEAQEFFDWVRSLDGEPVN
jgi:hypothetical protein